MFMKEGLTFDDVLLVPEASDSLPNEVSVKTKVTNQISLNIPIISSAMDTVTEDRMAIAMAQAGGLGVIHRNLSVEKQALMVSNVKRFVNATVNDPITISPGQVLKDARKLQEKYNITGFPVIDDKQRLLGIVTNRDMRFAKHLETPVEKMMTSSDLAVVLEPFDIDEARDLMEKRRIEKILVVNSKNVLKGLMTLKDLEQSILNPQASKDELGKLRVAAASTVGRAGLVRSTALVEAGVDLLVIDTAHGHSKHVIKAVEEIKKKYCNIPVLAGNVSTGDATRALIDAGADAVKVGIGPGSICTTRMVAGVGVPQLTAIMDCVSVAESLNRPIVADGGIKFSGDLAKAIAAGADCVMIGAMLAGTDESPGEMTYYEGRTYKFYRGMGSVGAMARGSADRYFQKEVESDKLVPEGVEGRVPYKGAVGPVLHQLVGGLRAAMGYTGKKYISEMRHGCKFLKITNAGLTESHSHDVALSREAPNYRNPEYLKNSLV